MPAIDKHFKDIYSWEAFFELAKTLDRFQKGNLFERLTQLILLTRPEYHSKLKNVWRVRDQIPKHIKHHLGLPNADEGIDLIAETNNDEYWAIQCKFKGNNSTTTVREISTFGNLCNSYCKNISQLILAHTGEKEVKKKILLGPNFTQIGLEFWLNLKEEDWQRIHKQLEGKSIRPVPRNARPHQQEAIKAAANNFLKNNERRGRILMPCGTGKSLTAFWIANVLRANSVIVAVPSLSLIKQSLEDWTREFLALNENPIPEWLCICSDESTGNLEKDEFVSDTYSLGIPTTTDINKISEFLLRQTSSRKIVFTTYQSSYKLAQATRNTGFTFDLALLDEAHKTVGVKAKTFATLLSDENIKIQKRIFMTATERVIRGNNNDVYSMDDENIYGKQFFHLSFKKAIHSEPKIICDYKILTVTVTNKEIKKLITENKFITDIKNEINEQEAQSLAAAIALRKAYEKYGIKHAISFHRSIKAANSFAHLNKAFNKQKLFYPIVESHHISSQKSAGERAQLMKDFTKENFALMTNARCLTEGVDVPAIDCVLFADPKQSTVDIIQAAGRALRPYKGKNYGYIMLPIIIPDNKPFEEFAVTTAFKKIAKIISALSTQDERIAEELSLIYSGKKITGARIIIEGKIPIGLHLNIDIFAEKINALIWGTVAKVNIKSFQDARKFVHSLNLKNIDEWRQYAKSGKKPEDITASPHKTYKNKGWHSWGDWLGTGSVHPSRRINLPFEDARRYVHTLKLKNQSEWLAYAKSFQRPNNIPPNPHMTYRDLGWINLKDWLGTDFLPFKEARNFVHTLNLSNQYKWIQYCRTGNRPLNIPSIPDKIYKDDGWKNWGDWLGTYKEVQRLQNCKPFEEAKKIIHSLGLKNRNDWREYCRSGNKPNDIPAGPEQTYKNKGWISMGDWLGTGYIADKLRTYLSFNEARIFVHTLNLRTQNEWIQYCKSGNKPNDIPAKPDATYKNKGWIGIGDWLGTGKSLGEYLSFEDAKKFIHTLNFKKRKEWEVYRKSNKIPQNIPTNPQTIYNNKGWINISDWLGKGFVIKKFRNFQKARKFVHSLNLKTQNEWIQFCKAGEKPIDIPTNPNNTYKLIGWINMGDWLGTGNIHAKFRKYLSYQDAKNFIQSLNLKSGNEWRIYTKSGMKPIDIPADPTRVYKNKGWISWGDWLGTGRIADQLKKFRPYNEAKTFALSLTLKNQKEWTRYCQLKVKPFDIPASPEAVYKNKGWISWGDWLGTGYIGSTVRNYLPFNEARIFVHSLNLKSSNEWNHYSKSQRKPNNIPAAPVNAYKNKGWISWGDWLGNGKISNSRKKYRTFENARKYVQSFKLKNNDAWLRFCKSKNFAEDIPKHPNKIYKNKGWKSVGDWLGTDSVAHKFQEFLSYNEAKKYVHSLKLKNLNEWRQFCISGKKPSEIPSNPDKAYKNNGWINSGDWLGTQRIATQLRQFKPFEEARKFIHLLNLKTQGEWIQYIKSGKRPADIPAHPQTTYKNEGWISMGDWLGTGKIADQNRVFQNFKNARKFIHSLSLKTQKEWIQYTKSGKKPPDIPVNPQTTYKHNGWISMGDWLGTGKIADQYKTFLNFQDAKEFVHLLNLKTQREWVQYIKSGKRPDIPSNPYSTYKNKGWVNWGDWLGQDYFL